MNHIAAPSQNCLYRSFLLSKLCENRKDRGAISSSTASEGTPYTHIHVLTYSYFTVPSSSSHYSFSCRPSTRHVLPPFTCSHLSFGRSFSPPSLLHSTLQRRFPYPIPTLFRSPSHHFLIPPAVSPRSVSHSRKSQSRSLQAFSEESGPWPCLVPLVSMDRA